MPLMIDLEPLQPYLDTVRNTRTARLALINTMKVLHPPHTTLTLSIIAL